MHLQSAECVITDRYKKGTKGHCNAQKFNNCKCSVTGEYDVNEQRSNMEPLPNLSLVYRCLRTAGFRTVMLNASSPPSQVPRFSLYWQWSAIVSIGQDRSAHSSLAYSKLWGFLSTHPIPYIEDCVWKGWKAAWFQYCEEKFNPPAQH
jgi:hypothetical protein